MNPAIVIFGASGDLTSRKLVPALYLLSRKNRLPPGTKVVGVARSPFQHAAWREQLAEAAKKFLDSDFEQKSWDAFAANVFYHRGDISEAGDFTSLKKFLDELQGASGGLRLFYLATMPSLYPVAVEQLGASGLAAEAGGPTRVIIEKPFGTDLGTARALNEQVHKVFAERQVYRIDHYLGKETVQNMMVLRFANSIFEPVWNRNYIDHVQITVAEEVVVGRRGSYYDNSGLMRDMFQNHMLQLLMMTAMEAPVRFEADLVRDEKVKVLRAIRPLSGVAVKDATVRGQYAGYLQEEGVAPGSQTPTFAAVKLLIDNWRWNNVPFYLRSGKAMSCRTTQIVIQFRQPPHLLFDLARGRELEANRLVVQVQPAEGIQLHLQTKVPDAGMRLQLTNLDFRFDRQFAGKLPEAYQRLLLDAINGDASLFARSDEVELAWGIVDPILAAWKNPETAPPLDRYDIGMWGPESSDLWMRQQKRDWFDVCPVIH